MPRDVVQFYDVGGQVVFPLYGMSGGLCTEFVCYPMVVKGTQALIKCARISPLLQEDKALLKIIAVEFEREVESLDWSAIPLLPPGADLGIDGTIHRINWRK
jgi:hypothetical protein